MVLPSPEMPEPQHIAVDVVIVGDEIMSGLERCLGCESVFDPTDAALRIRDFRLMIDYLIHRRCIEKALLDGPVDDQGFITYRDRLAMRYSH